VLAGFLFEHLASKLDRFFAFLFGQPMTNLVSGARRLDERKPVAAWLVSGLRDDLNDVAVAKLRTERRHAAVDFRADATVTHFGVNGVCKIDRRRITRQ